MSLSLEEVRKIAILARLKLTQEEEQKYTEQLSAILDYVDQLKNVKPVTDVTGLEEIQEVHELRTDISDVGRHQTEILNLAATKKDNYFSVPAVFTEEE